MAKDSVRFYCEQYPSLSTVIAGEVIKFHNHEYVTNSEIEIKALDKMLDVERYEKAMEKKQLLVDGNSKKKLEIEVKKDIIEQIKSDPKQLKAIKDELREELGEEYEKELEAEVTAKLIANPPKDLVKKIEEELVKKPSKALIDAVKKLG